MQTWHIVTIVTIIIGNIALIKYSAKVEFKKHEPKLKNTVRTKKP
ncbi:DUF2897 family protein [Pseudoalteromonas sp. SWXJZ94C]|nr:DUF2897 family protein [Pseudoalteromonas sp. SWXJZ94C]MBH0058340.1 DUF2897 family protein [Pseudoalteromonas sp. SWXJZ94C]